MFSKRYLIGEAEEELNEEGTNQTVGHYLTMGGIGRGLAWLSPRTHSAYDTKTFKCNQKLKMKTELKKNEASPRRKGHRCFLPLPRLPETWEAFKSNERNHSPIARWKVVAWGSKR